MTTFPDLSVPLREAIVGNAGITALLPAYKGSYPVFTRTPVPNDAPHICVVISQNLATTHEDGICDIRVRVEREIYVSGENDRDWQRVDQIARQLVALFHRKRQSLSLQDGWRVTNILASTYGLPPIDANDPAAQMAVRLAITIAARR